MFTLFGKRKQRSRKKALKKTRKPPAALLRKCKKHKIKTTIKRGGKRVYKKIGVLKKELRRKMKKHSKKMRSRRSTRKVVRRRFAFGSSAAPFVNPGNFGYNQPVQQNAGVLSQSTSVIADANANINRPPGFGVDPNSIPTYGTYAPFFTENVPRPVGPNWYAMGQPDGSLMQIGSPFSRYTSFGRKKKCPKGTRRSGKKCVRRTRRKAVHSRSGFGEFESMVNNERTKHPWWDTWATFEQNKKNKIKYDKKIINENWWKEGGLDFGKS